MKLIKVNTSANVVSVRCCDCARWVPCDEMYADVEGCSFKSYYCNLCVTISPEGIPVATWLWKLFANEQNETSKHAYAQLLPEGVQKS